MSLTGQWKTEKSLFTQEMAMRLAKGQDWLGFKTMPGNVLYVNLEISEEKFQERTQDFFHALGYKLGNLSRFRAITIIDTNLGIDNGTGMLTELLEKARQDGFPVDVLILDPRARCVAKSENEEVVIKALCDNVDKVLKSNPGLSVIFVTHMGKDPTKGAIGHSRFVGWLDTDIKIVKDQKLLSGKKIEIKGRDTEQTEIGLKFHYPLHSVVEVEEHTRRQKVHSCSQFIQSQLAGTGGEMEAQKMRQLAFSNGHSDYAFWQARTELLEQGRIRIEKASGQGNRKKFVLSDGPGSGQNNKQGGNDV